MLSITILLVTMIVVILYRPPYNIVANIRRCPCGPPSTVIAFVSTKRIAIVIVVIIIKEVMMTTTIAMINLAIFEVALTMITMIVIQRLPLGIFFRGGDDKRDDRPQLSSLLSSSE